LGFCPLRLRFGFTQQGSRPHKRSLVLPPLDDGAKPNRLRKPLHCGVGVAGAPLPLGGRVRRGVVRDPARDLGGKQGR